MRRLLLGDCRALLAEEPAESVHACLTDPPYDLTSIQERFGKEGAAPCQHGRDGSFQRLSRGFMQAEWDGTQVSFDPETWRAVWRVLKPGAWLLAFGGTRTSHRQTCAIEDAGFEVRDTIHWTYFTGFPKGLDVGKGIDKRAGAEREVVGKVRNRKGDSGPQQYAALGAFNQSRVSDVTAPATLEAAEWDGWNIALKPSHELILVARKPLSEPSVAANVLRHGTGALNVEAARLFTDPLDPNRRDNPARDEARNEVAWALGKAQRNPTLQGARWPANTLLSHGPECSAAGCQAGCPVGILDAQAGERTSNSGTGFRRGSAENWSGGWGGGEAAGFYGDTGPASRFFATFPYESPLLYFPKPTRAERDAGCEALPDRTRNRVNPGGLEDEPRWAPVQAKNTHPCVKPVNLLRYLARLICPPGGVVLDPFAGSGSTGVACALEGFGFLGMEQEPDYLSIAEARCAHAARQAERGKPLLAKTRSLKKTTPGQRDLFGDPQP